MTVTLFLLGALYVVLVVALLASGVNGVTVAMIAGGLALLNLFALGQARAAPRWAPAW